MKITHDGVPQAMEQLIDMVTSVQNSVNQLIKQCAAPSQQEKLITIEEACSVLGLAKSTVYAMTQAHKIPFYQPGKKLMFKRSELISWMEQTRHESESQTHEKVLAAMQSGIRRKPANAYKL